MGDIVYRRPGVNAKKYLVLICGVLMGFMSVALGLYVDHHNHPSPSCAYTSPSYKMHIAETSVYHSGGSHCDHGYPCNGRRNR